MGKDNNSKRGSGFRLFSAYIRFFHNIVYYKKIYALNRENIPEQGPLMIVSDHQNCLSDALGVVVSMNRRKSRKLRILSRGDIFKPLVSKPLRWLGIMPSYRLLYDGEENLSNNSMTFDEVENELLSDGTIVIYPEAGHQDKHWLGQFSLAYLRILFETARKADFKKEFFILPSCNHYSDYFGVQEEILIKYGTPISIAPFYELYKTKPRTAQRQVNALVRQQVSDLMLNITDLDNYEAIDYLRNSYGVGYACKNGYTPTDLSQKLLADKQLYSELERIRQEHPESIQTIYNETRELEKETKRLKLNDCDFDRKPSVAKLWGEGLLFLLFSPLFLITYIAHLFVICFPKSFFRKFTDVMFWSTVNFGASVLITIPITYITLFILIWCLSKSILYGILCVLCMPFLAIFAWRYKKSFDKWLAKQRYHHLLKQNKLNKLADLRKHIFDSLDNLLIKHT